MMTYYASMLAMGYYILTGIFTIAFLRKRYSNFAILYNLMILQFVQVLAALMAAVAYAIADDPIFSLWWGVITCMAIASVRMGFKRIKTYRESLNDIEELKKMKRLLQIKIAILEP